MCIGGIYKYNIILICRWCVYTRFTRGVYSVYVNMIIFCGVLEIFLFDIFVVVKKSLYRYYFLIYTLLYYNNIIQSPTYLYTFKYVVH